VTPDVPLAVGKPQATLPAAYALEQNYPNPFNPSTVIRYELPAMSNVKLTVYNVIGQVVATLKNGVETAGAKSVEFNASALPSGVYFYRFEATGTANPHSTFTMVKKLMLLK
jgi:hypothetical protein